MVAGDGAEARRAQAASREVKCWRDEGVCDLNFLLGNERLASAIIT